MTETQWNKEIVRDYFRCAREQEVERLLAYLHPRVALDVPGSAIGGQYQGIDGVRSYLRKLRAVLGTQTVPEVNALVAEGNRVTADVTLHGPLPDGQAISIRVLSVFELQDRKIARQVCFFDTEEMARCLGNRFKELAAA